MDKVSLVIMDLVAAASGAASGAVLHWTGALHICWRHFFG